MDIKNLKTFILISELRNFTKAAKQLGYTQSTVSFQIHQLEEEIGAPLFERTKHQVFITPAGEKLLPIAYEMQKLSDIALNVHGDKNNPEGVVRIAIAESLASWTFGNKFISFHKKYPKISLKMYCGSVEFMLAALENNEADIIYTIDRPIYDNSYKVVLSQPVKMNFVVASNHPLAKIKVVSPKELISYPLLLTEKDMSYRAILDRELARNLLSAEPLIEVGDTHLIMQLIKKGIGCSLLPDYIIEKDVNAGKLSIINVPDLTIDVYRQLFYKKTKNLTPAMEKVIATLSDNGFPSILFDA